MGSCGRSWVAAAPLEPLEHHRQFPGDADDPGARPRPVGVRQQSHTIVPHGSDVERGQDSGPRESRVRRIGGGLGPGPHDHDRRGRRTTRGRGLRVVVEGVGVWGHQGVLHESELESHIIGVSSKLDVRAMPFKLDIQAAQFKF